MREFGSEIGVVVRGLIRTPGFTLLAVFTLALGIAANTAIFAVLNAAFFQSLGIQDEARVVVLSETESKTPAPSSRGLSYLNFADWRKLPAFSSMVLLASENVLVNFDGAISQVSAVRASSGLSKTLGVAPLLGRDFDPAEELGPGVEGLKAAMISESFWRTRFAGSSDVLQQQLTVDDEVFQIVGVLPDQALSDSRIAVNVWLSQAVGGDPRVQGTANGSRGYGAFSIAYARLAPGSSTEEAEEQLERLTTTLAQQFPDANQGKRANLRSVRNFLNGDQQSIFGLIFAATLMLLLIACANLASLLIARFLARASEWASREVLGASKARIARGVVLETLVICATGALLGALLAIAAVHAAKSLLLSQIPNLGQLNIDARVFLFASVIAFFAGILSALAPVLYARRLSLATLVREHGRGLPNSRAQNSQRRLLVVLQLALTSCLLIGAMLLVQSLQRLTKVDPGFDPTQVLTGELLLPEATFPDDADVQRGLAQVRVEMLSLPGVSSVSYAQSLPFSGQDNGTEFDLPAHPFPRGQAPEARLRFVDVDYLSTIKLPLLEGRDLLHTDGAAATPIVLINKAFAEKYFTGAPALGQQLKLGWGGNAAKTIVGIVGNLRHRDLADESRPEMYVPTQQFTQRALYLLLRFEGDANVLAKGVAQKLRESMPGLNLGSVQSLEAYRDATLAAPQLLLTLIGGLAAVALLLSVIGLLGLLQFIVTLRESELGLRIALGARAGEIFMMMFAHSTKLIVVGAVFGGVLATMLTGLMRQWLFQTQPLDWMSFLIALATLAVSALLVSIWPSVRAARVNANGVLSR